MADINKIVTSRLTKAEEAEIRLGGERRCSRTVERFAAYGIEEKACGAEVRVMGIAKRDSATLTRIAKVQGMALSIRLLCTSCGYVDFDQTEVAG